MLLVWQSRQFGRTQVKKKKKKASELGRFYTWKLVLDYVTVQTLFVFFWIKLSLGGINCFFFLCVMTNDKKIIQLPKEEKIIRTWELSVHFILYGCILHISKFLCKIFVYIFPHCFLLTF